jgi:1-phosphatidylinositol-4-phosphate 5-kinase
MLIESLDPSKNIKQIQNAGEGAGASGSFFFFCSDRKFILKTMSSKEIKHMIRCLPSYFEHMETYQQSFIARIYGVFSVNIDKFEPIHVLIMQNTLPNVPETELAYLFDMKGSSINRQVLKVPTTHLKQMGPTKGEVLKDLDYVRLKDLKKFMKLSEANADAIKRALEIDIDFLKSQRFMDYSLLFSVRSVNQKKKNNSDDIIDSLSGLEN